METLGRDNARRCGWPQPRCGLLKLPRHGARCQISGRNGPSETPWEVDLRYLHTVADNESYRHARGCHAMDIKPSIAAAWLEQRYFFSAGGASIRPAAPSPAPQKPPKRIPPSAAGAPGARSALNHAAAPRPRYAPGFLATSEPFAAPPPAPRRWHLCARRSGTADQGWTVPSSGTSCAQSLVERCSSSVSQPATRGDQMGQLPPGPTSWAAASAPQPCDRPRSRRPGSRGGSTGNTRSGPPCRAPEYMKIVTILKSG